jgi:hypothetical protein
VLVRAAQVNTYGPGQSSRRRYALVRQSGTAGLSGGSTLRWVLNKSSPARRRSTSAATALSAARAPSAPRGSKKR